MARRTPGKKIDTFVVRFERLEATVTINMNTATNPTSFIAVCVNDTPPIDLLETHTSIDKLRENITKLVKQQLGRTWQKFIHVQVSGSPNDGIKTDNLLDVHYNFIEISDFGKPTACWRIQEDNPNVNRSITEGMPEVGLAKDHSFHKRKGKDHLDMNALIEDNERNRKALKVIADKISELRQKLKDLLSPKHIDVTLAQIWTNQVLTIEPKFTIPTIEDKT